MSTKTETTSYMIFSFVLQDADHPRDRRAYTLLVRTPDGNVGDLNATGAPCFSVNELRKFVKEFHRYGAYDAETRDALLVDCDRLRRYGHGVVTHWHATENDWVIYWNSSVVDA